MYARVCGCVLRDQSSNGNAGLRADDHRYLTVRSNVFDNARYYAPNNGYDSFHVICDNDFLNIVGTTWFAAYLGTSGQYVFHNNIIAHCDKEDSGGIVGVNAAGDAQITQNTFYNLTCSGAVDDDLSKAIQVATAGTGSIVTCRGNIISECYRGLNRKNTEVGPLADNDYNCVHHANSSQDAWHNVTPGANSITDDPRFVNPQANDFRPQHPWMADVQGMGARRGNQTWRTFSGLTVGTPIGGGF